MKLFTNIIIAVVVFPDGVSTTKVSKSNAPDGLKFKAPKFEPGKGKKSKTSQPSSSPTCSTKSCRI